MQNTFDDLVAAVSEVAQASHPGFFEVILGPFLAAFFGAAAAYAFAKMQWTESEKTQKLSRSAQELRAAIEELQNRSVDYWCKDYDRKEIEAIEIAEAKIHSLLQMTRLLSRELINSGLSCLDGKDMVDSLRLFESKAYDIITGDNFESAGRKASKAKVKQIVKMCTEQRAGLAYLC